MAFSSGRIAALGTRISSSKSYASVSTMMNNFTLRLQTMTQNLTAGWGKSTNGIPGSNNARAQELKNHPGGATEARELMSRRVKEDVQKDVSATARNGKITRQDAEEIDKRHKLDGELTRAFDESNPTMPKGTTEASGAYTPRAPGTGNSARARGTSSTGSTTTGGTVQPAAVRGDAAPLPPISPKLGQHFDRAGEQISDKRLDKMMAQAEREGIPPSKFIDDALSGEGPIGARMRIGGAGGNGRTELSAGSMDVMSRRLQAEMSGRTLTPAETRANFSRLDSMHRSMVGPPAMTGVSAESHLGTLAQARTVTNGTGRLTAREHEGLTGEFRTAADQIHAERFTGGRRPVITDHDLATRVQRNRLQSSHQRDLDEAMPGGELTIDGHRALTGELRTSADALRAQNPNGRITNQQISEHAALRGEPEITSGVRYAARPSATLRAEQRAATTQSRRVDDFLDEMDVQPGRHLSGAQMDTLIAEGQLRGISPDHLADHLVAGGASGRLGSVMTQDSLGRLQSGLSRQAPANSLEQQAMNRRLDGVNQLHPNLPTNDVHARILAGTATPQEMAMMQGMMPPQQMSTAQNIMMMGMMAMGGMNPMMMMGMGGMGGMGMMNPMMMGGMGMGMNPMMGMGMGMNPMMMGGMMPGMMPGMGGGGMMLGMGLMMAMPMLGGMLFGHGGMGGGMFGGGMMGGFGGFGGGGPMEFTGEMTAMAGGALPTGNVSFDLSRSIANAPPFSPAEMAMLGHIQDPQQRSMQMLQMYMQKQALMATVITNLAQMRHDMLKAVAQNLRS